MRCEIAITVSMTAIRACGSSDQTPMALQRAITCRCSSPMRPQPNSRPASGNEKVAMMAAAAQASAQASANATRKAAARSGVPCPVRVIAGKARVATSCTASTSGSSTSFQA